MARESSAIGDEGWLARFHAGDRRAVEDCYREHYQSVARAVSILRGADQETVIHEVFYRLLSSAELRQGFAGGSLSAWLHTVARNQAVDFHRRARRDVPLDEREAAQAPADGPNVDADLDARRIVERFKREVLPEAWAGVFDKRFLQQLDQREAAKQLGISRTTLAYRELRIRSMLKRFVLRAEEP